MPMDNINVQESFGGSAAAIVSSNVVLFMPSSEGLHSVDVLIEL